MASSTVLSASRLQAGSPKHYETFITELRRVCAKAPLKKYPKNYNFQYYAPSPFIPSMYNPFTKQQNPESISTLPKPYLLKLKALSPNGEAMFLQATQDRTFLQSADSSSSTEGSKSTDKEVKEGEYIDDIPLLNTLYRHVHSPHSTLLPHGSPLLPYSSSSASLMSSAPKVKGIRIEVYEKRGTRANKSYVWYGKLNTSDFGKSYVDFGRSRYTLPKGATGVKVWVAYGN